MKIIIFLYLFINIPIFLAGSIRFSLELSKLKHEFLSPIEGPCNDGVIYNKSLAKWPHSKVLSPWEKYAKSNLYKSDCFMRRLEILYDRKLAVSPNVTYGLLVNTVLKNNCTMFLHGGIVRDLIQGVKDPHDVDSEFSCEADLFFEIMGKILPESVFKFGKNHSKYFHIGGLDGGIDAFYWDAGFFDLKEQEYTPNSLYYDTLNNFTVDLSGKGLEDARQKFIRIPLERDDWDSWLFNNNEGDYIKKKFLRKIPRFWKLKASGYTSPLNATNEYLMNVINNLWENSVFPIKATFLEYVCTMLELPYDNRTNICYNQVYTEKSKTFCKSLTLELKKDFKNSADFVKNDMNRFLNQLECYIQGLFFWSPFVFFLLILNWL